MKRDGQILNNRASNAQSYVISPSLHAYIIIMEFGAGALKILLSFGLAFSSFNPNLIDVGGNGKALSPCQTASINIIFIQFIRPFNKNVFSFIAAYDEIIVATIVLMCMDIGNRYALYIMCCNTIDLLG